MQSSKSVITSLPSDNKPVKGRRKKDGGKETVVRFGTEERFSFTKLHP